MSAAQAMSPARWPGPLAWVALLAIVLCCSAVAWAQDGAPAHPGLLAELGPYAAPAGGGAGLVSAIAGLYIAWPAIAGARARVAAAVASWGGRAPPEPPAPRQVAPEDEPTAATPAPSAAVLAQLATTQQAMAEQVGELHSVLGARDDDTHGFRLTIRLQRIEDALTDTYDAIAQLARALEHAQPPRPPRR